MRMGESSKDHLLWGLFPFVVLSDRKKALIVFKSIHHNRPYPPMWLYLPQKTFASGGDYEQNRFLHKIVEFHGTL